MIHDCTVLLNNLDRLEALNETGLFGSDPEVAFNRLNHLATKLLKAPISIFSLIGDKSQFFKSASGFEITKENNEVPIDVSVCQYSLQGKPLSIEDTKNHPMFSQNPAVRALNIVGYLGIPVITKSGQAIGAVCVIDHKKRAWTLEEISMLEDITASFISEIELRQAISKAENEIKLREEFIAIASHELKNPLNGIKIQTQLVQKKLEEGIFSSEDNLKFLTRLERQTQRLELLIDDMSDAVRLNTGKLSLSRTTLNINQLIQSIVENLEGALSQAGCVTIIKSNAELIGYWDSPRLEQVFTNLLSNAMKYAPKSSVEIILDSNAYDRSVTITFKDNGPGISDEDQKKLFTKFGRVSDSQSIKGLGLGLYISRQIIKEHGGSLELETKLGEGCLFKIVLPLGLELKNLSFETSKS
jgi:signal transduction histidine kinase